MGSFHTAIAWIPVPIKPDWAKAREIIEGITYGPNGSNLPEGLKDGDIHNDLLAYELEADRSQEDLDAFLLASLTKHLETFIEGFETGRDDMNMTYCDGNHLVISGGMSNGGDPTEYLAAINRLNEIEALHAAGFYKPWHQAADQ